MATQDSTGAAGREGLDGLKASLMEKLIEHLKIPVDTPHEYIRLNLGYFFAKDENTANSWITLVESCYGCCIPADEVDYFFFFELDQMAETILAHVGAKVKPGFLF